jgi:perosamine synthetase
MRIPQVSPWLGEAEITAVQSTLTANWITEGPCASELSQRLNELIGAPYGVFAPNGTLALYLALLAAGIQPGDEVLVPDTTFIASANAVVFAGATPVFVDVQPDSFQIDPALAEGLISERTRAIMPVHLFGSTANMAAIMALAQRHRLLVIEDAAQAIGVFYNGQHAGSFGDFGCFSFFADKTITMGEGGYVVCRSAEHYERLQLLRNQGRLKSGSFTHPALGLNLRITDMQAAIGLAQLQRLPTIIARKQALLEQYREQLAHLPNLRFLSIETGSNCVPFRCVILVPHAAPLQEHLRTQGIEPRQWFVPLHRQPCFAHLDRNAGGPIDLSDGLYPNAITGYTHGVLLPIHPTLTDAEVQYICHCISDFYREQL